MHTVIMLFAVKNFIFPDLRFALIITFIFIILILIGTLTPLPQKIDAPGTDKWHHFIAFAALTYPLTASNKRFGISIVIFGLCLGAAIEIIQPYVNRFSDLNDFKADAVGIFIGYLIGSLSYKYKNLLR